MSTRLIIIIIMLAISIIIGFTLTWPKFQDLQQVLLELKQKEAELRSKTAYYSKIEEIWKKLEKYDDVLPRIDGALPNSYSIPDLFHYLQKTAGGAGLVIKNLTHEGVSGKNVKEISLGLQASGSYSSLVGFLSALENSARFFKIQNVSFSSPKEGGAFLFNLTITTYSY